MYLIDSNVFLQVLLDTDEAEPSASFLNDNSDNISTTLFNLMEISSVLTRKYKWDRKKTLHVIEDIKGHIPVHSPDEYDILEAFRINCKDFLTPIDSIMLSIAERYGMILVTYDKELLKKSNNEHRVIKPDNN